jgi:hypothetical protein
VTASSPNADAELVLPNSPSGKLERDRRTQHHVLNYLLQRAEPAAPICVLPVSFDAMASLASHQSYIEGFAGLSEAARKRLLGEIYDFPDGVPPKRVLELVNDRHTHDHRRTAALEQREVPTYRWSCSTGVTAVGCDVTYYTQSELRLVRYLRRFQSAAGDIGLRTFVHGVR